MERVIEVRGIKKAFGDHEVLRGVDFAANKGEVTCIIGSSGSGKSTLLRCINLLETPDEGQILYHGEDILSGAVNMPRYHAKVGMVFQQFNLFGNMDVLNNCVTGQMKVLHRTREESVENAMKYLKKVGMDAYINAKPRQLSGGQKQRVAIARALATNPRYLLCDEATSALDPNTTRSILELLREINKSLGVTIIVITHEMKVIDQICDRVAVIDKSCIAEEGRVADVFTNPKSDIARELVLPQERPVLDPTTGGRKLRLIFNGEDTQKPVISEMILACRVPVNVLFADTKSVEGAAYGHMILELPNDEHDAEKVVSWLKNSGLTWKEER